MHPVHPSLPSSSLAATDWRLSRRALVVGTLGLAAAAWVGSSQAASAANSRRVGGQVAAAVPTVVPSYGPNGTHWPSRTPYIGDDVDREVEVDCTWAAIASAISAATATAGTARILVRPGTLTGNGAGATSNPVMADVGSTGRATRILVYPRDGYGSVTVTSSWRIRKVQGVTIGGFVTNGAILLAGCSGSALARAKVTTALNVYGLEGVTDTRDIELVEVVVPDAQVRTEDITGVRTVSSGVGSIHDITRIGCYTAPAYKPTGSSAHTDTIQLSGSGSNTYGGLRSVDCVDFASTNTAFQIGSADDIAYEHCLVLGGSAGKKRYPLPATADTGGSHNVSNGGGQPQGCTVKDSVFIGGVGAASWASVSNTRISYQPGTTPAQGSWTVDASLTSWSVADTNAAAPYPTDAYLASIWT